MDASKSSPRSSHTSPPQVVTVVGWLLVACFVIAIVTRLATKLSMRRLLGIDDHLIIAATITGIGQMGATHCQTQLSTASVSTEDDWDAFQKAFYSSQLLFVPTICLTKLSVLFSLHKITPVVSHQRMIILFSSIVIVELLVFELAAAFQCSDPRWAIFSETCFDQTSLWQVFGVFDLLTDIFIALAPIYIVATLQMGLRLKVVVAGAFFTRTSTIAASICRLIFLTKSRGTIQPQSINTSDNFWIFILSTQIEQSLSIITACIPFLKPFFESLETGMLAGNHGPHTVSGYGDGSENKSRKIQGGSNESYRLREGRRAQEINVSRRISISTHSEECGLIKEEGRTWVGPGTSSQV